MVTELVGAITKDTLLARQKKVKLENYLPAVEKYVTKAADDRFVSDLQAIAALISDGSSVIAAAKRLMREENAFFQAILASLPAVPAYKTQDTELGRYMRRVDEAGSQYQQVFVRELQTLLLEATGIDSAIIQVAAPVSEKDLKTGNLPGVPSVTVNRSLVGGARMFHDGTVQDDSWRARLTQVLSAVSNV